MSVSDEIATEAVKTLPPVAVAAATWNEYLIIAGIIWIAIQAFVFIHKYIVWLRAGKPTEVFRRKRKDEDTA